MSTELPPLVPGSSKSGLVGSGISKALFGDEGRPILNRRRSQDTTMPRSGHEGSVRSDRNGSNRGSPEPCSPSRRSTLSGTISGLAAAEAAGSSGGGLKRLLAETAKSQPPRESFSHSRSGSHASSVASQDSSFHLPSAPMRKFSEDDLPLKRYTGESSLDSMAPFSVDCSINSISHLPERTPSISNASISASMHPSLERRKSSSSSRPRVKSLLQSSLVSNSRTQSRDSTEFIGMPTPPAGPAPPGADTPHRHLVGALATDSDQSPLSSPLLPHRGGRRLTISTIERVSSSVDSDRGTASVPSRSPDSSPLPKPRNRTSSMSVTKTEMARRSISGGPKPPEDEPIRGTFSRTSSGASVIQGVGPKSLIKEVQMVLGHTVKNSPMLEKIRSRLPSNSKFRHQLSNQYDLESLAASDIDLRQAERKKDLIMERWKLATTYVRNVVRTALFFKPVTGSGSQFTCDDQSESRGLSHILKEHQSKTDVIFSTKIQVLLSMKRTEEVITKLEKQLTIRLRGFAKYTPNQRLKFCEIMTWEAHEEGRVIIKEGHTALSFYFLVSGQCEVYRTKDHHKYRINIINPGDGFGDRHILQKIDTRTATVSTTMFSEFLRIDKSDYMKIAFMNDEENLRTRMESLATIPIFSSNLAVTQKLVQACQIMQYEAREIMIVEGAQSACVHWILKGSCRALKKVKFVKRETGTIIGGGKKYSLVAYTDGMPLEETDEVVEQMLCAMELTPGSLYPEFPRYKHYSNQESSIQMALSDEERNINKLELIARLTYEDPDDQALGSYYSIVANTKCEIAVMSRVDYVRLASNEMVKSVLMDRESYIVPVQRLQDVFLEKRNWDMYKRKVVAGLVSGGK